MFDFKDIISGVPQGLIVHLILFNAYLNVFFFLLYYKSVVLLSILLKIIRYIRFSVTSLVEILIAESENGIKWFSDNKFKATIIQQSNQ